MTNSQYRQDHGEPAAATPQREDELVFRYVHHASPELLFDVMTQPEHLCMFWGPDGMTTPRERIVVDLRPGGAFETAMVSDDGAHEYVMRAIYTIVDRPDTLAWSEPESGMLTTITFKDLGDGRTEVTTHQVNVPARNRSPEAQAGFKTSLVRCQRYVAELVEAGRETG